MVHVQVTRASALHVTVHQLAVMRLGLLMDTAIQSIITNFVDLMQVIAVQVIV
tara:strand:- start:22 stop:180 length:159 start_codon:yes stop_codon:yes gene_type:complete